MEGSTQGSTQGSTAVGPTSSLSLAWENACKQVVNVQRLAQLSGGGGGRGRRMEGPAVSPRFGKLLRSENFLPLLFGIKRQVLTSPARARPILHSTRALAAAARPWLGHAQRLVLCRTALQDART